MTATVVTCFAFNVGNCDNATKDLGEAIVSAKNQLPKTTRSEQIEALYSKTLGPCDDMNPSSCSVYLFSLKFRLEKSQRDYGRKV